MRRTPGTRSRRNAIALVIGNLIKVAALLERYAFSDSNRGSWAKMANSVNSAADGVLLVLIAAVMSLENSCWRAQTEGWR